MAAPKTVLITGCSSGLGRALAIDLHGRSGNAEGKQGGAFRVFASARNTSALSDLAAMGIDVVQLDVTSQASVDAAIKTVVQQAGSIDVLINNAGLSRVGPVIEQPLSEVQEIFDANLFGVVRVTQAVAPHMMRARAGLIVMIGSVTSVLATPFGGAYAASKAALLGISDSLRLELAPFGVHVTHVTAGAIKTSFADNIVGSTTLERYERLESLYRPLAHLIRARAHASQDPKVAVAPDVAAAQIAATALAHNLCLAARPTAARVVGGRRVPALRSASTTRCQAATVLGRAAADDVVTIRFDSKGKPVVSVGGTSASAGTDEKAELAELANQFNIWNSALQTGDPEQVANLYADDGILLPTVSNQLRPDHAGKVDYFTSFLQLKPFGTIDDSFVRFLTPERDVGSNSGIYTFALVKEGKPVKVQARYSFIYRKIDGVWKITEHHSSAMPEPVAEPLDEVRGLFDIWNNALQTGDPEQVANLYADDGLLLPTVSNKIRPCHESKVDYFTSFLQLKPYGTIDERNVRFLNPAKTLAANSGIYTFNIVKEGKPASVQARYSFIYRKIGGAWKIVEHHSSAMPELPAAAPAAAAPAAAAKEPVAA
ncbi:hypothetical protein D9Q98_003017 [Chlorella vulgaris]|uniref:Calcium/calmodulin-dependent protein kinase II association-domain domain-containing protein n=1 Tax=Chlorella vulgaris TaxID=3077 RepID=A0A9D4YZT3_CHLVU|nr:hypothetical protein D9Q98_003017 [Chlorella vulgaris]